MPQKQLQSRPSRVGRAQGRGEPLGTSWNTDVRGRGQQQAGAPSQGSRPDSHPQALKPPPAPHPWQLTPGPQPQPGLPFTPRRETVVPGLPDSGIPKPDHRKPPFQDPMKETRKQQCQAPTGNPPQPSRNPPQPVLAPLHQLPPPPAPPAQTTPPTLLVPHKPRKRAPSLIPMPQEHLNMLAELLEVQSQQPDNQLPVLECPVNQPTSNTIPQVQANVKPAPNTRVYLSPGAQSLPHSIAHQNLQPQQMASQNHTQQHPVQGGPPGSHRPGNDLGAPSFPAASAIYAPGYHTQNAGGVHRSKTDVQVVGTTLNLGQAQQRHQPNHTAINPGWVPQRLPSAAPPPLHCPNAYLNRSYSLPTTVINGQGQVEDVTTHFRQLDTTNPDIATVTEPLPEGYWCGRFSSQMDRMAMANPQLDLKEAENIVLKRLFASCKGEPTVKSFGKWAKKLTSQRGRERRRERRVE